MPSCAGGWEGAPVQEVIAFVSPPPCRHPWDFPNDPDVQRHVAARAAAGCHAPSAWTPPPALPLTPHPLSGQLESPTRPSFRQSSHRSCRRHRRCRRQ